MARSQDRVDVDGEIWGTWEELLLAFAVNRHGTRSWDSVAMEVQSHTTAASAHLFDPLRCRRRFHLLQLRFSAAPGEDDVDGSPPDVPWLEDLRKIRVAELRREVERSDLSIVSLKLKVKKLKEECEPSSRETEPGGGDPNPKSGKEIKGSDSPGSTPEALAGDRISGRSCKESNSTDPKEDVRKPDGDARSAADTDGDGTKRTDLTAEPHSEEGNSAAVDPDPTEPLESGESAADSKGGAAEKDSSEVQSSASLTRRRRRFRRRKGLSAGLSSGADEPEGDVVSTRVPVVALSQPLISFLEIVLSSKSGSMFARRLESQETEKYRSTIRRHVDLEMVRATIERSGGEYSSSEFFRDLLLLCNNAIVFYPKSSDESIAAVHLRELISKHLLADKSKSPESLSAPPPSSPISATPKLKPDPDHGGSLLEKSTFTTPLISCRKRSSIAVKEEKPEPDTETDAEDQILKKKAKERPGLPPVRGLRTNKSRAPAKSPNPSSAAEEVLSKPEKKSSFAGAGTTRRAAKKRSAANFLSRMNRSSPSNGTLLESLKNSSSASGGSKAAEQKKAGKGEGRKEQASVKRSVGRPPKQAARKRGREETAEAKATPPAKKRGRR